MKKIYILEHFDFTDEQMKVKTIESTYVFKVLKHI